MSDAPPISSRELRAVLRRLKSQHGPQYWWPAQDGPFEIMVGAVLTQNTAWTNVEKAIANLRNAEVLEAEKLLGLPRQALAELIRPSGYYNIKADRLRNLCQWYQSQGGYESLNQWPTDALRAGLLSIKGVGPETCDDILLYAFERPVFVVDAYTFRLFERLGLIDSGESYESLRQGVEQALGADASTFNELHALIVCHGNRVCRPRPRCGDCGLRTRCTYYHADSA